MNKPLFSPAQSEFESLIQEIRPELHRYAARMIGSVIDGEDVVQEALAKAYDALPHLKPGSNMRGWLFRITHNKAIDHLRRAHLQTMEELDENFPATVPDSPLERKEITVIALAVFLKLAPRQRSCVILKDVLGYSLAEISELIDATVPEIKATLHRGRTRLRELSNGFETKRPVLDENERLLLTTYVERFNARDFEGVRELLADEVRLDLISRRKLHGASEVADNYFKNYKSKTDWLFRAGIIENRPAILVFDPQETSDHPSYFILLNWENGQVSQIRDYRYAGYVASEVEFRII